MYVCSCIHLTHLQSYSGYTAAAHVFCQFKKCWRIHQFPRLSGLQNIVRINRYLVQIRSFDKRAAACLDPLDPWEAQNVLLSCCLLWYFWWSLIRHGNPICEPWCWNIYLQNWVIWFRASVGIHIQAPFSSHMAMTKYDFYVFVKIIHKMHVVPWMLGLCQ